ncbi:MAG: hypothetical protein CVU10_08545 [Bacteroidetes bacterium HGW-Bacteroidetes-5]|nr:MAG: hypothetical protein CVU10_08545 [Bacteroidetes bacterium HGW-Bacteroidetes-5]
MVNNNGSRCQHGKSSPPTAGPFPLREPMFSLADTDIADIVIDLKNKIGQLEFFRQTLLCFYHMVFIIQSAERLAFLLL